MLLVLASQVKTRTCIVGQSERYAEIFIYRSASWYAHCKMLNFFNSSIIILVGLLTSIPQEQ